LLAELELSVDKEKVYLRDHPKLAQIILELAFLNKKPFDQNSLSSHSGGVKNLSKMSFGSIVVTFSSTLNISYSLCSLNCLPPFLILFSL